MPDRPWERRRDRDEDDDDDRPRNRRRDEDDEDDDRSRRRARSADDEDNRRRGRDDDDEEEDDRPRRKRRDDPAGKSNGLAIVGLVLGIASLLAMCLTGIPAVICSAMALNRPGRRGMAITGIILGCIGSVLTIAVIFLLPYAIFKIGSASERARDRNNLKQIALAAMSDSDATGVGFSAPYAHDAAGKGKLYPGLSFRVSLLPYMEEGMLYNQFDLKADWDSPRNKRNSDTIVKPYSSGFERELSVMTPYRAFCGGGAMFNEDGSPVRISEVTDGTARTILFVHATDEVPWAQPKELPYSPTAPLPALGQRKTSYMIVVMVDGSTHILRKDISEKTLRALITRSGNEFVELDD